MNGRAKIIARKSKIFSDDIDVNGPMLGTLVGCVLKALAQKHRIDMEVAERTQRRTAGAIVNDDMGV